MPDSNAKSSSFPWSGLVLATAVALGVWIVKPPLTSSRGERKGVLSESMFGDQTADARLWQDPFEVLSQTDDHSHEHRHSFAEMVEQIGRRKRDNKPVILMTVMLSGGPYSEDSESRLRTRRALVAALGKRRWIPSDSTHLGLFEFQLPVQVDFESNQWASVYLASTATNSSSESTSLPVEETRTSPLPVPYEWFQPTGQVDPQFADTDILVWWLTDRAFGRHPLWKLAYVDESLRQAASDPDLYGTNTLQLTHQHFGPRSSDSLKAMLAELYEVETKNHHIMFLPGSNTVQNAWSNLTLYSSWATAAEESLRPFEIPTQGYWSSNSWSIAHHFAHHHIAFNNYITRDDDLVRALLDELEIRNVPVSDPKVGVALISEYDTSYGRAFPETFRQQIKQRRFNNKSPPSASAMEASTKTVFQFGYLRGLDGERSSGTLAELATARDAQGKSQETQLKKLATLERAESRNQFDSLRRMTQKLVERDRDLRSQHWGGIRAIGVLGSDLHDKLIVLQALQPHFPQAIFVTTDLDARFLDPLELKWTRNLVVASGYGLELRPELQQPVPSFRESYQTAFFTSLLSATGSTNLAGDAFPPDPIIFEIGKTRAVQLNTNQLSGLNQSRSLFITSDRWAKTLSIFALAMMGLMFLLFLILAPNAADSWRREIGNLEKLFHSLTAGSVIKKVLVTIAVVVIVTLPGWYIWQIKAQASHPNGEPLYWMEGVSAWPTELLRLLVAYLCLGFCLWTRVRVMKNKQAITEEYQLPARLDKLTDFNKWCHHRLEEQDKNRRPHRSRLARLYDKWSRRSGWLSRTLTKAIHLWRVALLVRISNLGRFGKMPRELSSQCSSPPSEDREPQIHASDIWLDYHGMGYLHSRLLRVIPCILIYVMIGILAFLFWGLPFDPLRGSTISTAQESSSWFSWASWILHPSGKLLDQIALWASLLALWLLIFFVLDATLLCRQFIRTLTEKHVGWAESTYHKFREKFLMPKYYLEEWIDIQVISRRTSAIMPLIYFPFFTLSIMIASRSTMFDRWDWPWGLILMTGLNAAFVLVAAWLLRGAAENARQHCLRSLRAKHLELLGGQVRLDEKTENIEVDSNRLTKQVEKLMEEIEHIRSGAFAPLSDQPAIKAVLLPFGGAGALFFLDALSYM